MCKTTSNISTEPQTTEARQYNALNEQPVAGQQGTVTHTVEIFTQVEMQRHNAAQFEVLKQNIKR